MVEPVVQLGAGRQHGAAELPWAVIGAGPHGLTALKALLQLGVAAHGLERAADVGGLWNATSPSSRGYESLHMVSSSAMSQFPDFPMPLDYPIYPSRDQAQAYLRRYASHFGLYDHIGFGCEVTAVLPDVDGVQVGVRDLLTGDITTSRYAGAVIATGQQRVPHRPALPGLERFPGTVLHAAEYRSAEQLRDRRVLVIGGGSSGCDIAVDAGLTAGLALHSTRHGLRVDPTLALGRPVDQLVELLAALRVPPPVRRLLQTGLRRMFFGAAFDRRAADDDAGARNQVLPALVGSGRISSKPAVERFDEGLAIFTDGSSAAVDVVVLASGYRRELPFALSAEPGAAQLRRGLFPAGHARLALPGFLSINGGEWPVAHWQGMLIAHYARAFRDRRSAAEAYLAEVPALPLGPAGPDRAWDRGRYLRDLERDIRTLEESTLEESP
jgi:hypothetical protein